MGGAQRGCPSIKGVGQPRSGSGYVPLVSSVYRTRLMSKVIFTEAQQVLFAYRADYELQKESNLNLQLLQFLATALSSRTIIM